MNRRNKAMKALEKRLGRVSSQERHEEGEEGLLEQSVQEQFRSKYTLGSINEILVEEENDEGEENVEEFDEVAAPAAALVGAYAVNQQGEVRRGRACGDNTSITTVSDLETVRSDPMPPPPPSALLVEAQLAEPTDEAERIARLEQENTLLRKAVPLAQAELAPVNEEENSQSDTPSNDDDQTGANRDATITLEEGMKIRRKRFIVVGCVLLIAAVSVAVPIALTLRDNGDSDYFDFATLWPTPAPFSVIPANWQAVGQVLHGKAEYDYFGGSVSLSRDGAVIAIGANQADSSELGYVTVHLFNQTTEMWVPMGENIVGQAGGDQFGDSVSLNGDGTILAVGASWNGRGGTSAGQVRVYEFNSVSNHWVQLCHDVLGNDDYVLLGISVSLSDAGDILAAGASVEITVNGENSEWLRLFQYDRGSSSWNQLGQTLFGQADFDYFGHSVSLNARGTIVGVGAFTNDLGRNDAGQVSVYEYNSASSKWDLLGGPINGQVVNGLFGGSVSLDDSGLIVAVGAPGFGNESVLVYSYDRSTLTWNQRGQTLLTQQPGNGFGESVSLSGNGNRLAVGSFDAGQARIFQHDSNGDQWKQVGDPLNGEDEYDDFGWSVSLSADGSVVGVGARFADVNGYDSGSSHAFAANDN